jgi:hypothetical protein
MRRDSVCSSLWRSGRGLNHDIGGLGDLTMPLDPGFPQAIGWVVRESLAKFIQRDLVAAGACIEHEDLHASIWPGPALDFRHIVAVLTHIVFVRHQFVAKHLPEVGADGSQSWHSVYDVTGKVIPIK